jgi:phytoene desaturase
MMLDQIRSIDPRDVEGYLEFLAYAARLYRITAPLFIFDQPPRLSRLLSVPPWDALRFDGLRTMDRAIAGFVRSTELRQMLGLFATYVGASPFLAPATLNVIAHVEINEGLWYPSGGVYRIAEAFLRLAEKLGVEIRTEQQVDVINTNHGEVIGVQTQGGEFQPASAVIANFDVDLVDELLHPKPSRKARLARDPFFDEQSCSAFVMLLGVRGVHPRLIHHNTFFSGDYQLEFNQIFANRIPPEDPTIYVSISSKSSPSDAPEGCENWFVQVNVPAVSNSWDWHKEASSYGARVLKELADRGLDIRDSIEECHIITPLDIETRTGARGGALYGQSSNNRWSAFRRPPNRSKLVKGLYFAGGTTHPGGGVPMVALSGKVASEMLLDDSK